MLKRLFLWSFIGCYCAPAMAAKPISFNLGTHTEYFGAVQKDSSGGLRKFDWAPTLGVGTAINFYSPEVFFLPEFNWVLPREAGSDRIIKNLFMGRVDVGYQFADWFRLRLGTSLMLSNMHGRGGSETLNNGTGQSKFYYPEENRSSWNNTLDVGMEFFATPKWSARLQTYTYSLWKEERRQYSYTLFITYTWSQQ